MAAPVGPVPQVPTQRSASCRVNLLAAVWATAVPPSGTAASASEAAPVFRKPRRAGLLVVLLDI
jgi:hypothetical protein